MWAEDWASGLGTLIQGGLGGAAKGLTAEGSQNEQGGIRGSEYRPLCRGLLCRVPKKGSRAGGGAWGPAGC